MADPKCKLAVKAMLAWDGISPEEEAFAEQLCTLMEVAETSQVSFNLIRVLWESYGSVASSLLSAASGLGTAASAVLSPLLSLSPAVYASAWLAIPALMLAIAPPLPPYTAAQLSAMRPPTPGAKPEPVPTGTPAPTTQSVPLPTAQNPTVCPTETGTPERDQIVRHYTSKRSYRSIAANGWTINTSDVGLRRPLEQGIFFTDTAPFYGGYNRIAIGAILGVDLERTACYIDVFRKVLEKTGQGVWAERPGLATPTRTEYIFMYHLSPLRGAVDVKTAIAGTGSTSDLDSSNTESLVEKCG